MKPWNIINRPVVKVRPALKLKIEEEFWRKWQEKSAIEYLAQADRATTRALMVWSDDGGPNGGFFTLGGIL